VGSSGEETSGQSGEFSGDESGEEGSAFCIYKSLQVSSLHR